MARTGLWDTGRGPFCCGVQRAACSRCAPHYIGHITAFREGAGPTKPATHCKGMGRRRSSAAPAAPARTAVRSGCRLRRCSPCGGTAPESHAARHAARVPGQSPLMMGRRRNHFTAAQPRRTNARR